MNTLDECAAARATAEATARAARAARNRQKELFLKYFGDTQ